MTRKVTHFLSEGHRLFVTSKYSPAEIARLSKRDPRRVSEWRAGRSSPNTADRAALETAIAVPRSAWDEPPRSTGATAGATPKGTKPKDATETPALDDAGDELDALGQRGLEQLARQLGELTPTLPPKERLVAIDRRAKILVALERLRQAETNAREEYFASSEFRRDVELLVDAIPEAAEELRSRLVRLGVTLPPAAPAVVNAGGTALTVAEVVRELHAARELREIGEDRLARAHVRGLALDVHRIAAQLLRQPKRLAEVLELLDEEDLALRSALERAMAIRDVAGLDVATRAKVAELARQLGHADVAAEIGAGDE